MKNPTIIGFTVTLASSLTATFGHYWTDDWGFVYAVSALLGIISAVVFGGDL